MKIQSQNPFVINFQKELTKVKKQDYLILNEINQIEYFTTSKAQSSKLDKFGFGSNKTNSVFDLSYIGNKNRFNQIFTEYLLNEECELSEGELGFPHLKKIHELAKQFSQYYTWLQELQLKKPSSKKATLSHKQKMLVLHYLGLDLNKYDNTNTAKVLSQLLELSEDNTRKYMSYLSAGKNDVRTKNNLQIVSLLFENNGLTEISATIKKDLETIK